MNYLNKIKLKNFQSYYDENIFEFTKGLNCIIGSTNSGKSSIIRSLRFFLFNEWDNSFVSNGQEQSEISLSLDSGDKLERVKGKDVNRFILNGRVFENFGLEIPKEIVDVLEIHPIPIDDNKSINLNLTGQFESLQFLNETGTARAKLLDKLSGVYILDEILSDLNRDRKKLNQEEGDKEEQLKQIEAELVNYKDIEVKVYQLQEIKKQIDELDEKEKELVDLNSLSNKIQNFKNRYEETKIISDGLEKINIKKLEAGLLEIETKQNELSELNTISNKIKDIKNRYYNLDNTKNRLDKEYGENIEKYSEMLRKNKICPVCGREITEKDIERCISEIK
jgi:DNA repair exonuclease SbcCD ATPase subunit